MMRYVVIGLAILAIVCGIHAQFSITQQPMFSNAAGSSAQEFATNLAHRWSMTNLATNVAINTWTDQINGHQFIIAGGSVITNTTNTGVYFTSAGASMTNKWGLNSNLFNTIGPLGADTNYGMGVIFRLDPALTPDFSIRSLFSGDVNDGNPQYNLPTANYADRVNISVSANNFIWAPQPKLTPATNWFAMAWGATNNNLGQPVFVCWINGEFATNFGANTGTGPIKALGIRRTDNPAIFTSNFKGYYVEFWVRTNGMTGDGMEGFAKDLNWVRTNIYRLTNSVGTP